MITCDTVRRMALACPATEEKEHWGRPSFRVRDRIFATLWPTENMAMVKLSPHQQAAFVQSYPRAFTHVPNAWGRGATFVQLQYVSNGVFRRALVAAWRRVAPSYRKE